MAMVMGMNDLRVRVDKEGHKFLVRYESGFGSLGCQSTTFASFSLNFLFVLESYSATHVLRS